MLSMPQYHARTPSKNFIFYLLIKLEFQRQKVTAATILAWEGPARQLKPKNTIYILVKSAIRKISMCNPNHRFDFSLTISEIYGHIIKNYSQMSLYTEM